MSLRIIFDLDGTLVHSVPSLCATGNRLLHELGRAPVTPEAYVSFVGKGMRKQVEMLLEHTGGIPGELDTHFDRFRALYLEDPISRTTLYPDVSVTLNTLSKAGHRLGVCTQKNTAPAQMVLDSFALVPPIAALTAGDTLDVLKPDPRMLEHTAAQLGTGPLSDVVFIGDSQTDAQTADNAGVPFLLHANGYAHGPLKDMRAAAIFQSWDEVPGLIARLT